MLCNVFGIYHNFITRSHCFNKWSLSTRGMILVVSNVVYSSQYMGWTRGVDNATLFSCLLPGSVPAPVARVLSMMNAHNRRVEISAIPIIVVQTMSQCVRVTRQAVTPVYCNASKDSFAATATHKVFSFWSLHKLDKSGLISQ